MSSKKFSIIVVLCFLLLSLPCQSSLATNVTRGIASQYAGGVMDQVLRYRIRHGQIDGLLTPNAERIHDMVGGLSSSNIRTINLPDVTVRPGIVVFGQYDGFVARPHAHEIGSAIWLRYGDRDWEKFLVVDCGGIADGGQAWMLRNNVLVEVDFETARRWGIVGRGAEVEMSMSEPRDSVYTGRGRYGRDETAVGDVDAK